MLAKLLRGQSFSFTITSILIGNYWFYKYVVMSLFNFIRKASKLNVFLFFGIAFLLLVFSNLLLSYFFQFGASNSTVNYIEGFGKIVAFLMAVIWAPAIETLLYQAGIIHIIKAFVPKIRYSFIISVFVSSLVFGLSHPYSLNYVFAASITGLILATTYFISLYRKQSAFLLVYLLHALNNLLGLLTFLYK